MPKTRVEFVYAGIRVRNLSKSLRFYSKLGFRIFRRGSMEHGGKWVHLTFPRAAHRLELNYYPRGNRFYEPFRRGTEFDHFGFRVSNVAAWTRHLHKLHLPIVSVIQETHENLVYTQDPDGNWIEFFGPVELKKTSAQ
jgi:catechol 2,3-dioxygenase-like lactoylglutathione lyase family enzyme